MKNTRRVLLFALAIVLAVGMMPTAMASNTAIVKELDEASEITALKDGIMQVKNADGSFSLVYPENYQPPETAKFVDPKLKAESNNLKAQAAASAEIDPIQETYLYSYYTLTGWNITSYNSKGPYNQSCVASVTAGTTTTTTRTYTTSSTLSFGSSVSSQISDAVKAGFSLNASGTLTYTLSTGTTFSFKDAGIPNAKRIDYYIAGYCDTASCKVKRTDVYQCVIATSISVTLYDGGTTNITAYKPKTAIYYKAVY